MEENLEKKPRINSVRNRQLKLSPKVAECCDRELSRADFIFEGGKPIGKGGFGEVWKVTEKTSKKQFVIKIINKNNIIKKKLVNQLNLEIEINYKVDHPHIVKLVDHFEDNDFFYLIMNFASNGQLFNQLRKKRRLDEKTAAQCLIELISALKYLHSFDPPIIHRDIKPENILLDENMRVKLSDFGWSNYHTEEEIRKTYCGTPDYLAPEMLSKAGHDTKMDIWSLGVLIYELLTGQPPFSGKDQQELFSNIRKHKLNWPVDFPPLAKNLVLAILKDDPKDRITLEQILNHNWFKSIIDLKPPLDFVRRSPKQKVNLEGLEKVDKAEAVITAIAIKDVAIKDLKDPITNSQSMNMKKIMLKKSLMEEEKKGKKNGFEEKIFKEQIDILKKSIKTYKEKQDKLEEEKHNQLVELSRFKELDNTNRLITKENFTLKEEIEKLKIIDVYRSELMIELEEKDKEIISLKNQIKTSESELVNSRTQTLVLTRELEYLKRDISLKDEEIKELNDRIIEISSRNVELESAYTKKVHVLESKLLEHEKWMKETTLNQSDFDEFEGLKQFFDVLKYEFTDMKDLIDLKTKNTMLNIDKVYSFIDKSQTFLTNYMNEKGTLITNLLEQIKSSFREEIVGIKKTIENEKHKNNICKIERIDYLKKELAELFSFKLKCIELEDKLVRAEEKTKILENKITTYIDLEKNTEILINEKDKKLADKIGYICILEAKLSDIKHFVYNNSDDKFLEDFSQYYK